jgi:uncharacterized protein YbjQ (UPF0145 family)
MSRCRGKAIPSAQAQARQQAWALALSKDTVPDLVQDRVRPEAGKPKPWLSTMAPAELHVIHTHGVRPLATVSGTCSIRYGNGAFNGYISDEWINLGFGWDRAIARLKREALAARANAVVDVQMRSVPMAEPGTAEFTVIGTAIKFDRLPVSTDPVVATVSALDFVRLAEMDVVVCGIALGTAYDWLYTPFGMTDTRPGAADIARQVRDQLRAFRGNALVGGLTDFWEKVRREAHARLRAKAESGGNGILARTHFGQLIKVPGVLPNYVGRHMVMGTLIDQGPNARRIASQNIGVVVDMRGEAALLPGGRPVNGDEAATAFLGKER